MEQSVWLKRRMNRLNDITLCVFEGQCETTPAMMKLHLSRHLWEDFDKLESLRIPKCI